MPRPSKINDLFWFLSFDKNGFTWHQLLGTHKGNGTVNGKKVNDVLNFPRKTLDRHLKTLIKKGLVEKTYVRSGQKGRPAGKYKLIGKYWEPDSLTGLAVPNMIKDDTGKPLLTRTIRDSNRKDSKKTVVVGDYFEKYSDIVGDRDIKNNPYKDRVSHV